MAILSDIWPYIAALIPTAGLLFLFWVIMKHIVEGDRRERAAQRKWEKQLDDEAQGDSLGNP